MPMHAHYHSQPLAEHHGLTLVFLRARSHCASRLEEEMMCRMVSRVGQADWYRSCTHAQVQLPGSYTGTGLGLCHAVRLFMVSAVLQCACKAASWFKLYEGQYWADPASCTGWSFWGSCAFAADPPSFGSPGNVGVAPAPGSPLLFLCYCSPTLFLST